jgi:hypothetical protein
MAKNSHAHIAYGLRNFKRYAYEQRGAQNCLISWPPNQHFKSRSDRLPCQIKVPVKGTPPMPCVAKYWTCFYRPAPPRKRRLGSGLSRNFCEIGALKESVGTKLGCNITNTAEPIYLYHKPKRWGKNLIYI